MASDPSGATFRFYAELNDHLPPSLQYRSVEKRLLLPAFCEGRNREFRRATHRGGPGACERRIVGFLASGSNGNHVALLSCS